MTIQARCVNPIQGRIIRVTSLNACGVPVTGAAETDGAPAQIVMDGFTQVQQSPQYEEGERKFLRKANGQPCVNYANEEDSLTEIELTMDFCLWHPGLLVAAINARLLNFSASPTGTGSGIMEGVSGKHFSVEVWQNVAGDLECDPATGQQLYVYNAWPHVWNAHYGDSSINLDPTTLQIIGKTKKVSPLWTLGTSWLGAGAISSAFPDHWLWNITSVAPPAATCTIGDVS